MVVQHNLTAMNSNRMLGVVTNAQAKSSEKLSSGYKINRAADDAAGLSISEKMRKQINGLDRASTNAQDGVSAVQTAEGALTEVHSMLQRMNELAVQASNGTNSEDDRESIQAEIEQLTTEIDRVAETTKFNESYLLKGDTAVKTNNVAAHDAGLKGTLGESVNGKTTFKLDKALEDGDKVTIAGKEYTIGSKTASTDGYEKLATLKDKTLSVGDSITDANGDTYTLVDKVKNAQALYKEDDTIKINGKTYTIVANGNTDLTADKVDAKNAEQMVKDALAAGEDVYYTKPNNDTGIYASGTNVEVKIVTDLAKGEVSSLDAGSTAGSAPTATQFITKATANSQIVLAAGDVVTIKGKSITATASEPAALSNIQEVVKQLKPADAAAGVAADTIKIGDATNSLTITIADKTNAAKGQYTVEDALALINDNDEVTITANSEDAKSAMIVAGLTSGSAYTAVDTKTVSGEENILSKKEAYQMMAEELAKASSIGADKGKEATVTADNAGGFTISQGTVEVKKSLTFSLHVGADADMTNKIGIDIESMNAASLGIQGLNVKDDTGIAATYAVDAIADAVKKVSSQRSALGAVQNRLEHTIANLDNVVENTTSAESRIRDTDMAEEMVEYSKNNILAQAGQSMLAQANQSTQGVLSLLS